ncbi:MAG TPA: 30S ribosomal protein S4e [Candidatus Aenigmarchaeota archaeon]|nr:30S ribosomal protein S4e [Candidatus Aenigmarchaeota archaeon]
MPHLKRSSMPIFWPLSRKKKRFVFVPSPGPHPKKECIPLAIIVRDVFKFCELGKETKKIIKNKELLIDLKERTDHRFPVGLMDILTIKKKNENYLVLPSPKGFEFKKISDKEASFKYSKIIGKRLLKKGLQLNLHDGRNLLLSKEEKDKYKVGDTLKINLKTKKIEKILSYRERADVLIIKGANRGAKGKIKEIIVKKHLQGQRVKVEIDGEEKIFPKDFVFVIPKNFNF